MGFWDKLKDPFKDIPVVGGALEAVYDTLPVDNIVRAGEEIGKGNWKGALSNAGIGALETAAFFIPGSAAAAKASSSGVKLASKQGLGAIAKNIVKPGSTAGVSKVGKIISNVAGPTLGNVGLKTATNVIPKVAAGIVKPAKAVASPVPKPKPMSAGDFRRIEEADKKKAALTKTQTSAAQKRLIEQQEMKKWEADQRAKNIASGGGGGSGSSNKPSAPAAEAAPAAPATPATLDSILGALSPEQLQQVGDKRRELQRQYDLLTASFTKREAEGKQAKEASDALAANIAAGESQNLATNLGALGMDLSPVSAIVGQEGISNVQTQQQAQASRTLADLLAEIESGKARQKSEFDVGTTELDKFMQLLRIQNTLEQQANSYNQMEGI
jgi:hypothetical protein